jgi:hypothetical protein
VAVVNKEEVLATLQDGGLGERDARRYLWQAEALRDSGVVEKGRRPKLCVLFDDGRASFWLTLVPEGYELTPLTLEEQGRLWREYVSPKPGATLHVTQLGADNRPASVVVDDVAGAGVRGRVGEGDAGKEAAD